MTNTNEMIAAMLNQCSLNGFILNHNNPDKSVVFVDATDENIHILHDAGVDDVYIQAYLIDDKINIFPYVYSLGIEYFVGFGFIVPVRP